MSCEETRHSLSSYVDDCVSLSVRVAIDEHLDRCPVCRAEVAELRALTRSLSLMTQPVAPADLAVSISDLLTVEAAARRQAPPQSWSYRILRFLEPRLMPYTVGSFTSVIMFILMLNALRPHFVVPAHRNRRRLSRWRPGAGRKAVSCAATSCGRFLGYGFRQRTAEVMPQ